MKLAQPTVTITVQIATKTDKVSSDGEPLYRCGSLYTLYREADLMKAFKESDLNMQIKHDGDVINVSYNEPDIRHKMIMHDIMYGDVLIDLKCEGENGQNL
jgi:hypothetical protein